MNHCLDMFADIAEQNDDCKKFCDQFSLKEPVNRMKEKLNDISESMKSYTTGFGRQGWSLDRSVCVGREGGA